MKKTLILLALLSLGTASFAQKFMTRTANVGFFSEAPLENIEARTSSGTGIIDMATGDMAFRVPINTFQFEKALMQEHFNENYMESDRFPNAEFKGKITNLAQVNLGRDGSYPATVEGQMTIHGITQNVKEVGSIRVAGERISVTSEFLVRVADYQIQIPSVMVDNIAKVVKVKLVADMQPF